MNKKCNWCKKQVEKVYDYKGWKVCWDCYWKDVDKERGLK